MRFFWRILLIPFILLFVAICLALTLYLSASEPEDEEAEVEQVSSLLLEGMTVTSRALDSTVHLAFIVDNTTEAVTFIKSVLIHRNCSVHFHFITTDDEVSIVLNTLIGSWELVNVAHSVYPLSDIKMNDSWIPSLGYSESADSVLNELVKLHLPSVLPSELDRVILVDSQVIMLSNVWDVWRLFLQPEVMDKPLAVSRTNSVDFLHFDGTLIFYNLHILQTVDWMRIWHTAAMKVRNPWKNFISKKIVNTIITAFPNIHSFLPCQLVKICTAAPRATNCKEGFNVSKPYFISLKGVYKRNCPANHRSLYSTTEQYVNDYDSISMKKVQESVKLVPSKKKRNKFSRSRLCRLLREESKTIFLTRLFHIGRSYKPMSNYETTLVTQLSVDRLEMLIKLLDHWSGPLSVSMYGNDSQIWNVVQFLSHSGLEKRSNLAVHFVVKQGTLYPVNYLRNIALKNVKTDYVFLDDADFLPSYGLHERLLVYNQHLLSSPRKRALVIPAFQTEAKNLTYPSNKADLLKELSSEVVTTFCPTCKHQTHAPTRYPQWYESAHPYEIDWALHYEPYVIVKKDVVRYSQLFMGYGWNKVSQITELKAQGYQFIVIPDHFIIHLHHKTTKDKKLWFLGSFKFCIDRVWKKFVADLKHKYGSHCLTEKQDASIIFRDV